MCFFFIADKSRVSGSANFVVPDPSHGTTECAYFQAGQYLNVFLDIEDEDLSIRVWHFHCLTL